jgi:hypothetical protein
MWPSRCTISSLTHTIFLPQLASGSVSGDGRRLVALEREPERLWRSQVFSVNGKQSDKKLAILRNTSEPMLQRELEHRGLDKVNRGFEAKLIAWVEAAGSH